MVDYGTWYMVPGTGRVDTGIVVPDAFLAVVGIWFENYCRYDRSSGFWTTRYRYPLLFVLLEVVLVQVDLLKVVHLLKLPV